MAQATKYDRAHDFEADDPATVNGSAINSELDSAARSINQLRDRQSAVLRDDGGLADGVVTITSLDSATTEALSQSVKAQADRAVDAASDASVSASVALAQGKDARAAANSAAVSESNAAGSAQSASNSAVSAQGSASSASASAASAKVHADAAAVSASSATTTISEGKQAITDLQATAVAAIQTQKNEAVAAVTATQSTATESVTAAQASSVSAVKAQEAASIQAIEADSVLAGYAKKDELSSLIAAAVAEAKLAAYPVGSIYCSIDSTDPGALFGGTWAAIGAGRALVAAGGGFAVGSEGGADTHTLTVEEMPSHAHTAWTGEAGWHGHAARTDTANLTGSFNPGGLGITASGVCSLGAGKQPSNSGYATDSSIVNINASHMHNVGVDGAGNHTHTVGVGATGGGQAFSVRNPYIAVNMWRRTA